MSPGQRTMIENNIGIIRKVALKYVGHWSAVNDSWQFAVACQAVCEAVADNKWNAERGKFSTFVYTVSKFAIIKEWECRRKELHTEELVDVVVPIYRRLSLDVPYDEFFKNGFDPDMQRDINMFRRHIEGESITEIVKELGISRQSFYNRIKSVKQELAKHVVAINE